MSWSLVVPYYWFALIYPLLPPAPHAPHPYSSSQMESTPWTKIRDQNVDKKPMDSPSFRAGKHRIMRCSSKPPSESNREMWHPSSKHLSYIFPSNELVSVFDVTVPSPPASPQHGSGRSVTTCSLFKKWWPVPRPNMTAKNSSTEYVIATSISV